MPLPGALRSLPSRLSKVTVPNALLELGRFLMQLHGAEVRCKLTRLRPRSSLPCSRHLVRSVHYRSHALGSGCPV